jgi:DNA invertase Pin-like site-specific DNA recombinase
MPRALLRYPQRTGKLCFLYLRVSKGEKIQQSIPAQESIARRAAEAEGYRVVGIYKDEKGRGVRREGLHAMITAAQENQDIGAVFFWDYRRLWGHQEQYRRLNAHAMRAGYRLVDSKGKDHTSDTAMERFVANLHSNISELETATVGERVKETNAEKVRTYNQIVSRMPLGGKVVRYLNEDGQVRTRHEVDQHDMSIVRRAMQCYAANMPTYRIAELFVAEGVTTTGGKRTWSVSGLRQLLDNRFYIGEMRYNQTGTEWVIDEVTGDKIKYKRARSENEHVLGVSPLGVILAEDPSDPDQVAEAIELFESVQRIRDRKGREKPKRKNPLGVIEGLVYCGHCRKLMTRTRQSFRSRATKQQLNNFSYHCPYRQNIGTGCSRSHSMSERKILAELQHLVDRRGVTIEGESTWRPPKPDDRAILRAIADAERRVEAAVTAERKVMEAWEAEVYDSIEEFKSRRLAAKEKLAEAQADLASAESLRAPQVGPAVSMSDTTAQAFRDIVAILTDEYIDLDERRAGAASFIARIDVDNPTITVSLR